MPSLSLSPHVNQGELETEPVLRKPALGLWHWRAQACKSVIHHTLSSADLDPVLQLLLWPCTPQNPGLLPEPDGTPPTSVLFPLMSCFCAITPSPTPSRCPLLRSWTSLYLSLGMGLVI